MNNYPKLSDDQLEAVRDTVKQKTHPGLKLRKFWVAVTEEVRFEDIDTDEQVIFMDVTACGPDDVLGDLYQVFIPQELFTKRVELFRPGHRLVLMAETDGTPILYLRDAWFDRGERL